MNFKFMLKAIKSWHKNFITQKILFSHAKTFLHKLLENS